MKLSDIYREGFIYAEPIDKVSQSVPDTPIHCEPYTCCYCETVQYRRILLPSVSGLGTQELCPNCRKESKTYRTKDQINRNITNRRYFNKNKENSKK